MDRIYSKFIGVGAEGIETLNSYKSKLEKNTPKNKEKKEKTATNNQWGK